MGIEPTSVCLQGRLAYPWYMPPHGGPDRTRTDYLCRAKAALSQMSYGPRLRGSPRGSTLGGCYPFLFLYSRRQHGRQKYHDP